jgi:hypothetical protein
MMIFRAASNASDRSRLWEERILKMLELAGLLFPRNFSKTKTVNYTNNEANN